MEPKGLNTLRVSLASPDDILSWSFGEVTKPETINYRRLRPEKDGLFCEAIFGPTKDWQCYCGKYKNIRYKGVVCDKCGVEVTRTSVRRERMGHIALAAPVAHVWYTRRVPSYMGLLLDVSRRHLDRVLYFAEYVITHVDEDAREKALNRLDEEVDSADQREIDEINAKLAAAERYQDKRVGVLQSRINRIREKYEADLAKKLDPLLQEAQSIQILLEQEKGNLAKTNIRLKTGKALIVEKGDKVLAKHLTVLNKAVRSRLNEIETSMKVKLNDKIDKLKMDIETVKAESETETFKQQRDLEDLVEQQRSRIANDREELIVLKKLTFMNETRYRELKQKWGQVFKAAMGAEALVDILSDISLDKLAQDLWNEIRTTKSKQRAKKAVKRLKVVEAMSGSNNRPEWMIMTVLPVIPPDLRPMVQLDGGRFATSDLNDLYRRVINRNNRLKRLIELGAPDVIVRNEKRMLQESVDSLVDNAQRGKALSRRGRRELKSLSDMLKGKKGRFRRNLLGKRVDYSGRSVIVVGPTLKLNQCGLPRVMALELYRPFVISKLVEYGHASNVKGAKRVIERERPEVWEVLEEVIQGRPVLLNRAPTLHRLGIQAFEPVLVEGKAIHIHPLVCAAFNADFDGDQMAVHVPLSRKAVEEAYGLMLSTKNLLKPADGEPIIAPSKDMVLGVYYLTMIVEGGQGEGRNFADINEVELAYSLNQVELHTKIGLQIINHYDNNGQRYDNDQGKQELVETTVGRALFNRVLPQKMQYVNELLDKTGLQDLVGLCYQILGPEDTINVVDEIKRMGFKYATRSGTTVAVPDITVPESKELIVSRTEDNVSELDRQFQRGLLTEQETTDRTIELWQDARKELEQEVRANLDPTGNLSVMALSGATKGGFTPISQLAGMRGLMADPAGRIIPLPIRSNFREGLRALEYFISTHGARKGLADTALRTADAGYLTRRLCDVAQDLIINGHDCGTEDGTWVHRIDNVADQNFFERFQGRWAATRVANPKTGELIAEHNQEITPTIAQRIDELGIDEVHVRSPLNCQLKIGVCALCYGQDLGRGDLVKVGTAVGIIAAQSIGEPGTQLTLRTFHTGGVAAGGDITSGLPRVEELFEARKQPKGEAIVSEIDGEIQIIRQEDDAPLVKVYRSEMLVTEYEVPGNWSIKVQEGDTLKKGDLIASRGDGEILAEQGGNVVREERKIFVSHEHEEEGLYKIPSNARLLVIDGQKVQAGDSITEGSLNPHTILSIQGREACERHLLREAQKVYRSQGQNINDKHFEVVISKMLSKVKITRAGDTELLPGDLVNRHAVRDVNESVMSDGKQTAAAVPILLGITKASLATESFLSASSFQHTIRVLAGAAIESTEDRLHGLKENVIIGKLIPAGTGYSDAPELLEEDVDDGNESLDTDVNAPELQVPKMPVPG